MKKGGHDMDRESSHALTLQILLLASVILLLGHNASSSEIQRVVFSDQNEQATVAKLQSNGITLAQQRNALLAFKDALARSKPSNAKFFVNWTDYDPCIWNGVQCSGGNVTGLDISNQNLGGYIPGELANLSFLSSLSLASNLFAGSIPVGLNTFNLVNLSLSSNNLTDVIPDHLFDNCAYLQNLNLSGNHLGDHIPTNIRNCRSLKSLDLSNNLLVGLIPEELGQISTLETLNLHDNRLSGIIPSTLFASCQNLKNLDLSTNLLTGSFPADIQNCTQLISLSLSENQIVSLPDDLGQLKSLQHLLLGGNNISVLPSQLGNCKGLLALVVNSNQFSGMIPEVIGQFQLLQVLVLYDNRLDGEIPTWLATLTNLHHLDLSDNQLTGFIPKELASLDGLQFLILANNKLTGTIPPEIGEIKDLQFLDLSFNQLDGELPATIGNLQHLLWLMLAHNQLTGELPYGLSNCSSLLWLNLADNNFSGALPTNIGSIGADVNVTFNKNRATLPEIPKSVGGCNMVKRWIPRSDPPFNLVLKVLNTEGCRIFWNMLLKGGFLYPLCSTRPTMESLGYMQISGNSFTGDIPESIGHNLHLGLLFLDRNSFTGGFPENMSTLAITGINVSHNALSGTLPATLGQYKCLVTLDLSYNNFSGRMPTEMQGLTMLSRFNISYNTELYGEIPTQQQFSTFDASVYTGDNKLCISALTRSSTNISDTQIPVCRGAESNINSPAGRPQKMPAATIIGITLASLLGLIFLLLAGFCILGRNPPPAASLNFMVVGNESSRFGDNSVQVSLFAVELPKHLSYADLLKATNNFDEANVVGSGGFGVVYKAKLLDGVTVAIKKLIQEGPQAEREFLAEMETLGHVHHENLVPLMGCSSYGTEKLLVYKYMENGSLDDWLHERPGGSEALFWPLRLNIALGIAKGLKFLHHNCSPPIVHRDMKASNILLDESFEPRLTDFGLARVLGSQETHVSTVVAGTLGYVPPEYCQTWRATTKGDVYSFGVVLLELVTGKRPMSIAFSEKNCGNLVEWVNIHLKEGTQNQTYDPIVASAGAPAELFAFLKLGISCTAEVPIKRPAMREVLRVLEEIKAGNYMAAVTIQLRSTSARESI